MPEKKVFDSLLWKTSINGCIYYCDGKLCKNPIHFVCIFIVRSFLFGQKSWKLTEHYQNFLCTWKLIFFSISSYRDLSLCEFFPMDHSNQHIYILDDHCSWKFVLFYSYNNICITRSGIAKKFFCHRRIIRNRNYILKAIVGKNIIKFVWEIA